MKIGDYRVRFWSRKKLKRLRARLKWWSAG
jgi:hypothetical protein